MEQTSNNSWFIHACLIGTEGAHQATNCKVSERVIRGSSLQVSTRPENVSSLLAGVVAKCLVSGQHMSHKQCIHNHDSCEVQLLEGGEGTPHLPWAPQSLLPLLYELHTCLQYQYSAVSPARFQHRVGVTTATLMMTLCYNDS